MAAQTARQKRLRLLEYQSLPEYTSGHVPDGLATRRQLRAAGLSAAGLAPAARLHYCAYHYYCPLYRVADARPVRPLTDRQRQALAEGRKLAGTVWCRRCGKVRVRVESWDVKLCGDCRRLAELEWYAKQEAAEQAAARRAEADRAAAARWAVGILADPMAATLDTETAGLYDARVVEIAIVGVKGQVLLDTLVNPGMPIPGDATAVHGITDDMVAGAPLFADVMPGLTRILRGRRCGIWNEAFDVGILRGELDRYYRAAEPEAAPEPGITHPSAAAWLDGLRTECAMTWYAQWYGDWSDYWSGYTWQALHGGHRARGDCEAAIERLRTMAASAQSTGAGTCAAAV